VTPGRAAAGSPRAVLYLAWAPFFSGAERALLLTVQNLDPARYRMHVILGTSGDTLAAFRAAGVSCEVASIARRDRRHPLRWAASVGRVVRIARRVRAALIHSNDAHSYQPGGYAARLLRLPAVTHVRLPDTATGFAWFPSLVPGRRGRLANVLHRSDHSRREPGMTSRLDALRFAYWNCVAAATDGHPSLTGWPVFGGFSALCRPALPSSTTIGSSRSRFD